MGSKGPQLPQPAPPVPPPPPAHGPGALFKPSSGSLFDLCWWSVCLWLWLLVICPCLTDCSPSLPLPGDLRTSDLVTSLELVLTWLLSLTSSPVAPLCGHLAEASCHPRPILLALLRFSGTGQWPARSQPCYHFCLCVPQGAASPFILSTWKLDKGSSGCLTVHFLSSDSEELERVGYWCCSCLFPHCLK